MGVGLFYGAFIIVGGLLALLLSTIAVAAASSLSGSYAVFYGKSDGRDKQLTLRALSVSCLFVCLFVCYNI